MDGTRTYYMYILANRSRMLYVGVTGHLAQRVAQHQYRMHEGYTARYNITKLVHYEAFADPWTAIGWEKQVKGWLRARKVELIEAGNPEWRDLGEDATGLARPAKVAEARSRARARATAREQVRRGRSEN